MSTPLGRFAVLSLAASVVFAVPGFVFGSLAALLAAGAALAGGVFAVAKLRAPVPVRVRS